MSLIHNAPFQLWPACGVIGKFTIAWMKSTTILPFLMCGGAGSRLWPTRGDQTMLIFENESVYLLFGCIHRLVNPGNIQVEMMEVQTGSYLGERLTLRLVVSVS